MNLFEHRKSLQPGILFTLQAEETQFHATLGAMEILEHLPIRHSDLVVLYQVKGPGQENIIGRLIHFAGFVADYIATKAAGINNLKARHLKLGSLVSWMMENLNLF